MALDRHQKVARVWDWLPGFRAAAEYESLQRAALALSISPSALSRTIKLLEDELGAALFVRSPSGLTLTEHGHRLLSSTRDAMRLVHEGLPQTANEHEFRAGATDPVLSHLLFNAVVDVMPQWALRLTTLEEALVAEQLRCGNVDFALSTSPPAVDGLVVSPMPTLELVIASRPGIGAERFAALDHAGFSRPDAAVTSHNLEQLLSVGARLECAILVPRCLLPPNWVVHTSCGTLNVFAIRRIGLEGTTAPHIQQLEMKLKENLERQVIM